MSLVGLSVDDALREHPIIKDLSPKYIAAITACAELCDVATGEYLWRQGDQSKNLYLLQTGQVALEISVPKQGPLRIEILHDGDLLGCSNLMDVRRCQFDARALTPVSCIALDAGKLREVMDHHPQLGYELLKRLAPLVTQKLESARLRLFDSSVLSQPLATRRR